ncbi:hypothetical protein [Spirillospora sp. NPDC047279]|uniref:hypothetical protein n=1 Tax=Spirillospora sp. NPDC047279 TaxID=3155478 RepID=UPI003411AFEF
MTADEADGVFFREWAAREPGETRGLARARDLAARLGLLHLDLPLLTVVGSKGKGTAATYASAYLVAAGQRVCTVTSPGLRSNRDRVRLDGESISEAGLRSLARTLDEAMSGLPPRTDGYLSPVGLFTLAGALHARETGADVLVLEAGMGGRSDEVSLFSPAVVAVTPIFAEHVGVLGDTPAEIAADKAGVITDETMFVVSAPQAPDVAAVLDGATAEAGRAKISYAPCSGATADLLPAGLGRGSAELGCAAALRLLEAYGLEWPEAERLRPVLGSLILPGRLSWHRFGGTELLADSAIDGTGVAAALDAARARWGSIDHVLVCLPDHKDLDGAITALGGLPVTSVRLPYDHLRFERPLPPAWDTVESADLSPESIGALGARVVALGTVYFTGLVLDAIGAETERLFTAP